jgi:cytidylate kinase
MGKPSGRDTSVRVVTISATYGAGGSVVAPHLAERLKLPFADRLLPADDVTGRARATECLSEQERDQTGKVSLLNRLAYVSGGLGMPVPNPTDLGPGLREQVEASIDNLLAAGGAVVLGRAAAIVLADHPRALHVRLDAPAPRRLARAMAIEHIDEKTARDRLNETDRARTRYVQRIYGRDPADPALYHLIVDSTALPTETCVELIAAAAEAFWELPVLTP